MDLILGVTSCHGANVGHVGLTKLVPKALLW